MAFNFFFTSSSIFSHPKIMPSEFSAASVVMLRKSAPFFIAAREAESIPSASSLAEIEDF